LKDDLKRFLPKNSSRFSMKLQKFSTKSNESRQNPTNPNSNSLNLLSNPRNLQRIPKNLQVNIENSSSNKPQLTKVKVPLWQNDRSALESKAPTQRKLHETAVELRDECVRRNKRDGELKQINRKHGSCGIPVIKCASCWVERVAIDRVAVLLTNGK
jgi:hypothetical protein